MFSVKTVLENYCPPFLSGLKSRIQASPLGYRLARGAVWSVVGSLISRGLGLLAGVFVARLLGKHSYGQLGMVQSIAGMFGIFAGFGMGLTANKHVAELKIKDPARAGRIIGLSSLVSWTTGGLMTLVLLIFAPWLARHTLAAPEMTDLLRAGSLLLLLGGVNGAQTGALAGFEAFKTIARINLFAGLLAFPITLAGARFGVTGSVWALVINLAVNCILNFAALRREAARVSVPLSYQHCFQEWSVLWKFSLPAVLGGAISSPITWAASAWLVNQGDGYSQMGIYNAVLRIRIVPEMIMNMLLAPLLPVLSEKIGSGDLAGYKKAAHSAMILGVLITAPIALLQMAVPALTLLPYGHAYAGHPGVVQWMMLDLILVGLFSPLMSQIVASMNRMWFGFFNHVGFSIAFASLSYFLISKNGAAGLAASAPLAWIIVLPPSVYYIYRREQPLISGLPIGKMTFSLGCTVCLAVAIAYWLPLPTAICAAHGLDFRVCGVRGENGQKRFQRATIRPKLLAVTSRRSYCKPITIYARSTFIRSPAPDRASGTSSHRCPAPSQAPPHAGGVGAGRKGIDSLELLELLPPETAAGHFRYRRQHRHAYGPCWRKRFFPTQPCTLLNRCRATLKNSSPRPPV